MANKHLGCTVPSEVMIPQPASQHAAPQLPFLACAKTEIVLTVWPLKFVLHVCVCMTQCFYLGCLSVVPAP